jgi:putative ABC transport system permease protein
VFRDVRYALRSLLASPGMTAAAALTLALGIGANTAIFGGVNAIFLNPAPGVPRSSELVEVFLSDGSRDSIEVSSAEYRDYRDRSDVFSGLLAYFFFPTILSEGDSHERVWSLLVSANYFDVLGVGALEGRVLAPDDDAAGGRPVVVISYGLWQRRFAGRPDIVGATVAINNQVFTIVGVTPPAFRGTFPGVVFEAWIPLSNEDLLVEPGRSENRRIRATTMVGRLKRGIGPREAEARLQTVAQDLARTYPSLNAGLSAAVYPLSRSPRGAVAMVGPLIAVVMGVMVLLLIMTCANVANLLRARAAGRRREIAVRLALGASRVRLVRQLLVESLLLAAMGGVTGIGVGVLTARWLFEFLPEIDVPLDFEIRLDRVVMGFAMAATTLAAVAFGLLPARQAAASDMAPALKDGSLASVGTPARSRLRGTLVVAQMAVSLILLVAAGLFVRSLAAAQRVDPGFNPRDVLVGTVFLPSPGYDGARAVAFYRRLVENIPAASDGLDVEPVRGARPAAGGGRHLRRGGLQRGAADPGGRHPHGARRGAGRYPAAHRGRRNRHGRARRGVGPGRVAGRGPAARALSDRRWHRSAGARRTRAAARRLRLGRMLHSGAAGNPRGSQRRAAARLAHCDSLRDSQ